MEPLAEWLLKKALASKGEALMVHALTGRDHCEVRVHQEWLIEVQQATQMQSNMGHRAMIKGLPVISGDAWLNWGISRETPLIRDLGRLAH